MIGREDVANAQLLHRHKAEAIGERPVLVRVFAEQSRRVSMKISAAAIENAVNVCVLGFSLGATLGGAGDAQEGIAGRIGRRGGVQRFQAGGWLAPVGKHEAFALGDAAQYALRVLAEFEHGDGLRELKFKWELK
jgi:hypothetical protein